MKYAFTPRPKCWRKSFHEGQGKLVSQGRMPLSAQKQPIVRAIKFAVMTVWGLILRDRITIPISASAQLRLITSILL